MGRLTLEEFVAKRTGDREPMLDLNWYCLSLPFGLDLSYVETVSLPFPSMNMKPQFYGGRFLQFPGFQEISAFDITFYEDVRMRSRKWAMEWQRRIRDPATGAYFLPQNYKRDMKFALIDGTSNNTPIMTVTMRACWPTTPNAIDLSNTGGQPIKLQLNFATDGMEYE